MPVSENPPPLRRIPEGSWNIRLSSHLSCKYHLSAVSLSREAPLFLFSLLQSAVQDYLSVEALGDVFDFYIWSGTPREAMTAYGTLTGLPIFPPEWVFEPWAGGGGGRWRNGPLQDRKLSSSHDVHEVWKEHLS